MGTIEDLQVEKAATQRRIDFCFQHMRTREAALLATAKCRLYARLIKQAMRAVHERQAIAR